MLGGEMESGLKWFRIVSRDSFSAVTVHDLLLMLAKCHLIGFIMSHFLRP